MLFDAGCGVVGVGVSVVRTALTAALAPAKPWAGDRAGALATFQDAYDAARGLVGRSTVINDDPGANANRVCREIAVAHAEAGDATRAVPAVSGRDADDRKAETLATIASVQARLGDIAGAIDTAVRSVTPAWPARRTPRAP